MSQQNPIIYKSLSQVLKCLTGQKDVPEVRALLKLCHDKGLVQDDGGGVSVKGTPKRMDYPFVVIEGLDGTGKTTLTRFLSNKLNMKWISTPPKNYEIFHSSRDYFDAQPEPIKRAFYSLGNYLAVVDVANAAQPVVMDRFWHSTAAYAVANQVKSENATNDWDLTWPEDLLQPDLVIFLKVSEAVRLHRHQNRRNFTNTEEEQRTAKDKEFREDLAVSFRSVKGPKYCELAVDGLLKDSKNDTLKAVLEAFPNLKERLQQTA